MVGRAQRRGDSATPLAAAELQQPSSGSSPQGAVVFSAAAIDPDLLGPAQVRNGPMTSPASPARAAPPPPFAQPQTPLKGGNSPGGASALSGPDAEWLKKYEELKAAIAEPPEVKKFVRGQLERAGGCVMPQNHDRHDGHHASPSISRRTSATSNVGFVDLADPAELPDDFRNVRLCGRGKDMEDPDDWHSVGSNNCKWGLTWRRSRFNNAPMLDHQLFAQGVQPTLRIKAALFHFFFLVNAAFSLFDPSKVFFVGLCILCTWACIELDWSVDVNPTIFVSSIVFPLALSVNSAYSRRESALSTLATMRACALSLFDNQRAWREACKLPHLFVQESGQNILLLFHHTDRYLRSHHNEACKLQHMWRIYGTLDTLMDDIETLRRSGLQPPLVTRPVHELQQLIIAFENLRSIADYRTPSTIRAYARIAVFTISILLGTYWSNMVNRRGYSEAICLVLAAFFPSFFLMLICIQEQLEEPFGSDIDDIVMGPPRSITLAVEKATLLARLERSRVEQQRGGGGAESGDVDPATAVSGTSRRESVIEEFEALIRTQSTKVLTGGTGT